MLVQPLLEGVEGVDPALVLGRGRPPLELELAGVHHGAQQRQRPRPHVLAPVLTASAHRGHGLEWWSYYI